MDNVTTGKLQGLHFFSILYYYAWIFQFSFHYRSYPSSFLGLRPWLVQHCIITTAATCNEVTTSKSIIYRHSVKMRCHLTVYIFVLDGGAENAGRANEGRAIDGPICRAWNCRTWNRRTNVQDMKLQDMKMQEWNSRTQKSTQAANVW